MESHARPTAACEHGPVNKVVDSAFKPAPQSNTIQAELNHQRDVSADLRGAQREMTAALAVAREQAQDAGKATEFVNALQNQVDRLKAENETLKKARLSSIPLPEKPSVVPGDALKQWGDSQESKEE
ncbi:MAG: neutral trehalase [Verrucomicrobiales bacterium]